MVGDCTYLFIDSEGLGSVDQHATFDTQIFSLSILLSSLFILNTQGTINESALEQLELVVQMTDRIRVKEEKRSITPGGAPEEQSLTSLANFFPAFLWVLRDFTLDLVNARGDAITSNEYLEDALRPVPIGANSKKGIAEKNRIRQAIATVFPQRQCLTMVRPVAEERDLKRVSTLGASSLRDDFRTQIDLLKTQLIPHLAQPKSVEGVLLNGRAFVSLAKNYIDAINGGGIPTIRTAFQSVQEIQGREAMDAALDEARAHLHDAIDAKGDQFVLADDALASLLSDIESRSVSLIVDRALGSSSDLRDLSHQFVAKHLQPIFAAVRERNTHRAEKGCQSVVETLWEESGIEDHLPQYTTYKQLNSDVCGFWAKYLQLTKSHGSKSVQVEVGRTFLDKKRELIFQMLFHKVDASAAALDAATKANESNQKVIAGLHQELQEAKQHTAIQQKHAEMEIAAARKEVAQMQKALGEAEIGARTTAAELSQLREQVRAGSAQLSSAQMTIDATQVKFDATQSALTAAESELKRTQKEYARVDKALAVAQAEAASAASSSHHSSQQVHDLRAELASVQSSLVSKTSELTTLQGQFASFQQSLKSVEAETTRDSQAKDDAIKAKEKRIRSLEKSSEEAISEREETIAEQTRTIERLQQDKSKDAKQTKALEAEMEMLRTQLERAQSAAVAATAAAAAAAASAVPAYNNPLGLPPPVAGPLVSRKSVLPSSFGNGKRKSSPAQESSDDDEDVRSAPDANMDDAASDESSDDDDVVDAKRRASTSAAAAAAASSADLRDPAALTIAQLKSWLTSLDVEFPQKAQPKAFYVDLAYHTLGEPLERAFPRGQKNKKKK